MLLPQLIFVIRPIEIKPKKYPKIILVLQKKIKKKKKKKKKVKWKNTRSDRNSSIQSNILVLLFLLI